MKKLTLLILASCLTAIVSRADVIYQELFNYTNGQAILTGTNVVGGVMVTNWIRHSGSGNDAIVNNHRLEVSSSTVYGGVTVTRQDDIHRNFSITNGSPYTNGQQVLYASFVVNFTNLPTTNGAVFAHFSYGGTAIEGKLWALTGGPNQTTNNFTVLPNTFRLGVSAANSGNPFKVYPVDLALNTDYQVVMGWDPAGLAAITLWVNPVSSSDPSVTSGDTYTATAANVATAFAFRQASGFGGFLTASNLVVSTTFDEAFTNVLATNAVSPKIVYQPVGATNFVGSTVTLAAVAAGQGQRSLTYSWFQGAAPYANPGGNTNVLTLANAQVGDSGDYTLVVTTPYGLSATSSVAKVLISAAPVPPAFVTQPVSQSLYRGQNMILTTTVASPGNCTFTWFSNNMVVATTGPDNSGASAFEIDNLVTANSATYKVAVTNDIVANGIVSTNAVVTVLNPPHVSVSFLRSLVDPATFVPTASPTQPYEVTGTITTYTNITTGNTSSYYLQDGTGGINIFATFGSAFRPAQGDLVTYVGVMSSFTSGLELLADTTTRPYTSYNVLSSGNPLPAAKSIPFTLTNTYSYAYINTNLAGSLVKLSNVYFGTNSGNTISNAPVVVTNAAGATFTLSFFSLDLDTSGQVLPTFATSVTGVLYGFHPTYTLAVTKFSDIVAGSPAPPAIPLGIVYAGGLLTFNWTDPSFTLQSATNVAGPYIDIPGASTGFSTNTATSGLAAQFFRLFHP